jgi:pSer/pThr/pTyr-binding forkhead associated (FHA) protein
MEVTLIIHSVAGAREVPLTRSRLTLGRTDAADVEIDDQSLSRVHASVNRDDDRVWIIDEGSTNGTLVNGTPVPPSGKPLRDGDEIYLGNTTIVVSFAEAAGANLAATESRQSAPTASTALPMPIIAAAASLIVILFAAIVIGLAYRGNNDNGQITVKKYKGSSENDDDANTSPPASPSSSESIFSSTPTTTLPTGNDPTNVGQPPTNTKRYLLMSPEERTQFVQTEAQHVARMIGNREGYAFTPDAVSKIKMFLDTYALRLKSPKPTGGGCNMHHDLTTLLNRARFFAPVVVKSFNEKGLSPQVGLYLAMIEAEYCSCLSSGTGPKGFFQFASSTARRYGVQDVSAPHDTRPDDRCKIEIMAPIAAGYMKDLIAMFGTGPLSVPLAIASYNEGEGGLSSNLANALKAAMSKSDDPERSFWTMVAHSQILSDQFQREAIKYVPKFFAAAIVGENPRVFGVDMEPISSYTQPQSNSTASQ